MKHSLLGTCFRVACRTCVILTNTEIISYYIKDMWLATMQHANITMEHFQSVYISFLALILIETEGFDNNSMSR